MINKRSKLFLAVGILIVDSVAIYLLITAQEASDSNATFGALTLCFLLWPVSLGFAIYAIFQLFSFKKIPIYNVYLPTRTPLQLVGIGLLFVFLHLAFGVLLREWIIVGRFDLLLFSLGLFLMIFDGFSIFRIAKKCVNWDGALVGLIINILAVIAGFAFDLGLKIPSP